MINEIILQIYKQAAASSAQLVRNSHLTILSGKILLIFCVFSIAHQVTVQCRHVWNFKSLTWNMQGAQNGNTDSKWTSLGAKLNENRGNYDIVALQECGGEPRGAVSESRKFT